jgi:hypothetical protein
MEGYGHRGMVDGVFFCGWISEVMLEEETTTILLTIFHDHIIVFSVCLCACDVYCVAILFREEVESALSSYCDGSYDVGGVTRRLILLW